MDQNPYQSLNPIFYAARPERTIKDKQAPSAPTNLSSTLITDTSAILSWSGSTDNVGIRFYEIFQNNTKIDTSTLTTYAVTNLSPSTSYNFYVRAQDWAGNNSKNSNTLTLTTNPTPIPEPEPVPEPEPTPEPVPEPPTSPEPTLTKKIVGYYAAWAAYSGFTPDMIDVNQLTHINYAFANIGSDLKITMGYPDIDVNNFNKLNILKQLNPNLKTLIAVGGWTWSGRFSDIALTEASRTNFANSCVDFILQYGFDGVDIDWEYPVSGGLSTNIARPEDKSNFTLLMKTLRETLDAQSAKDNKEYLLSFAGNSTNSYIRNIELNNLHPYLDYGNIMTYDIHGMWDTYTDLTAPLFDNGDISPHYKWSVDAGVNAWINGGFPAEKIVMGIPFYGYIYNAVAPTNNGLYQTYSGSASISYQNIDQNYLYDPAFIRYFHSQSMAPWLFNGQTFISYEDEESIALKDEYIKSKGLAGAMIWELSQDGNRGLLTAVYNGLI